MMHASLEQRRRGFNIHAFVFVATMILLAAINFWTGAPYWVMWVLPGWGIGLFAHWFFVLGPGGDKRAA
jgi:2TM domain